METTTVNTSVLNDLVEINNDRVNGYEKAIKELDNSDADLRSLFSELIAQSQQCKSELSAEVSAAGEDVEKGTTASGKIYRAWMDVKAAFSGDTRKAVLESCEFGEDAAQKAYEMALKEDDLSAHVRQLITDQKSRLRVSHDKIKALRNAQ
jgi:uncharacterized protein (TIGR02284 family)